MHAHPFDLEVVLTWEGNALSQELYESPRAIVVGESDEAAFTVPRSALPEDFTLLEAAGDEWVLRLPPTAGVLATRGADAIDPEASTVEPGGARRLTITAGTAAVVSLGEFHFHVRATDRLAKTAMPAAIDWRAPRFVAASLLFHGLVLGVLMLSPPDASALNRDLSADQLELVRYRIAALEQEQWLQDDPMPVGADRGGAAGRPMEGPQGTAGATDERRDTGGGVRRRGDDARDEIPVDREQVENMTTFAAIDAAATFVDQGLSSIYGADRAMGSHAEEAYGPMFASAGFGPGTAGFDMLGTGRGGCPPGTPNCGRGTVGVGDHLGGGFGTCDSGRFLEIERSQGHAAAVAQCQTYGGGTGGTGTITTRMRPHRDRVPPLRAGNVTAAGGLSRETVRRVVHRSHNQVRFCYEQQLQSRPDLSGRVSVRFVISPTGAVAAAAVAGSSIQSPRVEACVASVVQRMTFPQAAGTTSVTYPFMFESH